MPLWRQLAEAYAEQGVPTNAAIFWKKLGKAYDDRSLRTEAIYAYEQEADYWALAGHADWGKADLLRADQLRTTVKLFLEQPAPQPTRPLATGPMARATSTPTSSMQRRQGLACRSPCSRWTTSMR